VSAAPILIVAPAWVGDMVMAHTLVQTLTASAPSRAIHLLAPPASAPLGARMPGVSQVHALPVAHGELALGIRRRLARALRTHGYGQAIVLPNSHKSAWIPWLAGIPRRTGFLGEARFGVLNDWRRLDPVRLPRLIDRFQSLGFAADAPQPVDVPPAPRLEAPASTRDATCARLGLDPHAAPLILCPGAEFGPAKQWPAGHFAAVARSALAGGRAVWLLGSPKDARITAAIARVAPGARDLGGQTSLLDAVDLLSCAGQVVSNDSGLMHVAGALGRPVIAVYGSTSPAFTPPLGPAPQVLRLGLPCSPCFARVCPLGHLDCLQRLPPERVLEAL
jgi:heptosyltransferase-2